MMVVLLVIRRYYFNEPSYDFHNTTVFDDKDNYNTDMEYH